MTRLMGLSLIIGCLACPEVCAQPEDGRVRVLLVTGNADLPWHLWPETTAAMRSILDAAGRFQVRVTEEPRGLNRAALEGYQVLVLNYHGPRWPEEAESAVEAWVRGGGGLVAVHQASYGPFFGHVFDDDRWHQGPPGTEWPAFAEMIGASWRPEDIGHARRTVFAVEWKDRSHPICAGLAPSFQADDELYHKLKLSADVHVLADALSPADLGGTGKREPLIWANRFGQGRVLFTTLGHDARAWREAGMADLLARGVEWAATGQVTVAPFPREQRSRPE